MLTAGPTTKDDPVYYFIIGIIASAATVDSLTHWLWSLADLQMAQVNYLTVTGL